MDGQFGTPSFIPKKPLATRSGSTINFGGLFLFVSILVFVLSLGGYGAVYFYEKKLDVDIKLANEDLMKKKEEKKVTDQDVRNLFNFNNKIKIAKDLLYILDNSDTTQHTTLVPLLNILRESTLKTVRFKDFKYSNVDNNKVEIRMSGEAKGYASIALQAKAFENATFEGVKGASIGLRDVVFTDLNLGANRLVVFNVTAGVDPELVSYANMIKNPPQR